MSMRKLSLYQEAKMTDREFIRYQWRLLGARFPEDPAPKPQKPVEDPATRDARIMAEYYRQSEGKRSGFSVSKVLGLNHTLCCNVLKANGVPIRRGGNKRTEFMASLKTAVERSAIARKKRTEEANKKILECWHSLPADSRSASIVAKIIKCAPSRAETALTEARKAGIVTGPICYKPRNKYPLKNK